VIKFNVILMKTPLIIAHRGASGSAPENTLAAIKLAMEIGVDMIEIDVHQSKDEHIVVFHDEFLDRITGVEGRVIEYILEELQALDAGSSFDEKFAGEKIPTLDEVLQLVDGKTKLLIEIKVGRFGYPGIEENLLQSIKNHRAEKWCIIQSFDVDCLEKIRHLNKKIQIQHLIFAKPSRFESIIKFGKVKGINLGFRITTRRLIDEIHGDGKTVYIWTVNDEKKMKKLMEYGVDGIITNYPEMLKKVIADLKL